MTEPMGVRTEYVRSLIKSDSWMMEVLATARGVQLPDWWISAGFVRSKVWDDLHGYSQRTPLGDVDLIYFDATNTREETEKVMETDLRELAPDVPWSVKNQARMHVINGQAPYTSSVDAMSRYPETATAVGVRLLDDGEVELAAPWGVDDLMGMIVRPTPDFDGRRPHLRREYERRVRKKAWPSRWPLVRMGEAVSGEEALLDR